MSEESMTKEELEESTLEVAKDVKEGISANADVIVSQLLTFVRESGLDIDTQIDAMMSAKKGILDGIVEGLGNCFDEKIQYLEFLKSKE